MKAHLRRHFLSQRDYFRFMAFVFIAALILVAGALNKGRGTRFIIPFYHNIVDGQTDTQKEATEDHKNTVHKS